MSYLAAPHKLHWSEERIMAETQPNGWEVAIGSQDDVDDKVQTFRANYSAMEVEIRRLMAEVRVLKEAKIDQEATQLAREHGFLSPFVSKSQGRLFASTPMSNKNAVRASPNVLNASAILDDEANFSLDDWASPVKDSPTSRLLRTPHRPKPYILTLPPSIPLLTGLPESLIPDPDLVNDEPNPPSPIQITSSIPPYTPHEISSPQRTPMRAMLVTPKNGPFGYEEPQARVLTRIVYIPRSSHWCEHICQILFLIMVITLSIVGGLVIAESGQIEALQGRPTIYYS